MSTLAMASPHPTRPTTAELDGEILRRAQQQEDRAFRLLYRHHQKQVHALLYRMLGPQYGLAIVEELSQETFLRVFRHLPDFDSSRGTRLSSWILTIAARLALNALRRRPYEALKHEVLAQTAGLASQRELAASVAGAVLALPADHRAAFVLREYHALDYREISIALKISVGTVKSRLSRARSLLRERLSEYRP